MQPEEVSGRTRTRCMTLRQVNAANRRHLTTDHHHMLPTLTQSLARVTGPRCFDHVDPPDFFTIHSAGSVYKTQQAAQ